MSYSHFSHFRTVLPVHQKTVLAAAATTRRYDYHYSFDLESSCSSNAHCSRPIRIISPNLFFHSPSSWSDKVGRRTAHHPKPTKAHLACPACSLQLVTTSNQPSIRTHLATTQITVRHQLFTVSNKNGHRKTFLAPALPSLASLSLTFTSHLQHITSKLTKPAHPRCFFFCQDSPHTKLISFLLLEVPLALMICSVHKV